MTRMAVSIDEVEEEDPRLWSCGHLGLRYWIHKRQQSGQLVFRKLGYLVAKVREVLTDNKTGPSDWNLCGRWFKVGVCIQGKAEATIWHWIPGQTRHSSNVDRRWVSQSSWTTMLILPAHRQEWPEAQGGHKVPLVVQATQLWGEKSVIVKRQVIDEKVIFFLFEIETHSNLALLFSHKLNAQQGFIKIWL